MAEQNDSQRTEDGVEGGAPGEGFPAETPISDMTAEQRAEYWKHKARKHEATVKERADYDDLRAQLDALQKKQLTAEEQALEAAREEGRREGASSTAETLTRAAVRAEVRAVLAAAGVDDSDDTKSAVDALLESLDVSKLATDDGVDTDKIAQIVRPLVSSGTARQGDRASYSRTFRQARQGGEGAGSIASLKKQYADKRR